MEKFSVLMSVYHREKGAFLRTALESVFNQTAPPNEVVLVKDGPLTTELDTVIEEFKNQYDTLQVVALPKNAGLGEALNQGLSHCSHELVARMDSDDICIADRFNLQLEVFEQHPELSVVGGWIDEFSTDDRIVESIRKLPEKHSEIRKFAKKKNPINHPSVMFKKSAIEAVNSYEHFYLLEDYWLWIKLLNNDYQFYNIQKPIVKMRGGIAMAARRGGWKYAKSEANLQMKMLAMGYIGIGTFCKNIIIRFTVRMMPNKLRTFVYKTILRG